MLSRHGPGVVFVMIQKQQDVEARKPAATATTSWPIPGGASLGELNTDESIVVLIDEAHRSHSSTLHMNLLDVAAELRPDRVHRHADHHGREEEDHRHLRPIHRRVPARRRRDATARSCRSCTPAAR